MWCLTPWQWLYRLYFKLLWSGIFHRRLISWQPVDQCDHRSPASSQTLILWRVSTSAGSVITALIEKRGALPCSQGSVFKSIICSPNPTGSSASPSWTASPFITQHNPAWCFICTVRTTCSSNYFSFGVFGLELLFIHILFLFLSLPPSRLWPNTHLSVVCTYCCFWSEDLSLFCCLTHFNLLQILCKHQLNVVNVNEKHALHFLCKLSRPRNLVSSLNTNFYLHKSQ